MKPAYRLALAVIWLGLLIAAAWLISQRLQLSGDLRKFMPGRDWKKRAASFKAARAAGRVRAATPQVEAMILREVYA